jgi:2-polyprenyl-3-methyl-5-hydroxy-6-metoxy-1,4-benzoquinol methylase
MQLNKKEKCEACGYPMSNWDISKNCTLSKCPKCNHIKRDLNLCNAGAREHAWGGSKLYDKIRGNFTFRRLSRFLGPVPNNKQISVLEIGFGSGNLLLKFLKKGYKIHGIEAEYLQIDIREPVKKHGTLHFGKAEDIKLAKEKFDLIYGIHVIEHLDNPAAVFQKCYSALKKGGALYFISPNSISRGLTLFRDKWWNLEDPTHIRFFSPKSLNIMLENAGFEKIKKEIPLWDSLTLEINSFFRLFNQKSKNHGIMDSKLTYILNTVMLPFAIANRIIDPTISPSLEVTAKKPYI